MTRNATARIAKPAFLALSCVGAFATHPALAVDGPDPVPAKDGDEDGPQDRRRDDIVVSDQMLKEQQGPKDVAPIVNTPKSIIVVPSKVIEDTGSATLQDALRTVPGITFGAAEGGNPIGDRPFIRGFDSQGSIYVDGVRDLSSQSRETFAVDSIQIVRGSDSTLGGRGAPGGTINIITKQPKAGTFGSIAGSYGMANYKRITGDVNVQIAPTIAFRIQGMWHDQDVAGRDAVWSRRWGVAPSLTIGLGTANRLTASYYYMQSEELPDTGLPYAYTIGNAPGTGMIYSEPAVGRFTTNGGQTGFISRKTFYGLANRDFRDTRTHQATLRFEHDFSSAITLRTTARYSYNNQAYIYTQPDDSQGNVFGTTTANTGTNLTNGGYVWRRANTRYGYSQALTSQTDLYGTFKTGSIEHSFAIGTELSWEKARRGTYVLATGSTISPRCSTASVARYNCTSLFNPNPSDPWVNYSADTGTTTAAITRVPTNTEIQNDGNTISVYGFDSITLTPQLILNLGARYDRFKSTLTPGFAAGATAVKFSRTDELFNWQAGLVFKPTEQTSIYASYATAAIPPNALLGEGSEGNALPSATTTVAGGLDQLKVQKTRSYEVGAKASLFRDKLALGIAAYQTEINNARVTIDANTVAFLGKTRMRGVELTVNGTILPGWTVFGGYTLLNAKIIDGGFSALTAAAITGGPAAKVVYVPSVNNGKQVPQTAKNSISLWTTVEATKRFSIGGGAFFMDRQFGGYADNRTAVQNTAGVVTINPATKVLYRTIPSYWRFDARVAYKVTDNIQLSVNAQNLTDKTYFTQAYASHYASIAPGRTVFGTLEFKF